MSPGEQERVPRSTQADSRSGRELLLSEARGVAPSGIGKAVATGQLGGSGSREAAFLCHGGDIFFVGFCMFFRAKARPTFFDEGQLCYFVKMCGKG